MSSSEFERDISRAIGNMESSIKNIEKRAEEDRELQNTRHSENQDALQKLGDELKKHAVQVQMPHLAQGEAISRIRLATLASVGLVTLWIVGRALEAGLGWFIERVLHMKFGG